MVFPNSHVARVTGFYNIDRGYAKGILEKTILDQLEEDERHLRFEVEIVPSCNSKDRCIGIVDFEQGFPQFLTTLRPAQQIDGEIERNYDRQMGVRLEIFFAKSQNRAILTFDADFLGFTQLYSIDRGKYPEIVADLGGLIVSRAVADGHDHRNAHGLRNPFVNPVCAYVLFGVPFFGLYTADLEAALPVNSSRQTLVRQLGHDYQERKIEQFIEKVKRDRAQVINIQENRHTRAIQKVS
ncbi:MAG: hypothetical protein M1820_010036 [Bogoriella megaspora]|nr:MAG: hypothetical protein M1820_010036 [Bogoriella megaspora]